MDGKKIAIIVVLVIVLYIVIRLIFDDKGKTNLVNLHNAKHPVMIPSSKLPKNEGGDYAYSIWMYVNEWNYNYGHEKVIFRRKGKSSNSNITKYSPKVSLAPETNNLVVEISTEKSDKRCVARNIPLQKWTHVVVTTYNNTVDIYLDGKLVKSCLLTGVPLSGKGNNIEFTPNIPNGNGGSFSGFTRSFKFYSKALNPREVYEIYKLGPKGGLSFGSLFDRYKMKFSFLKDNLEINSIEI